MADLIQLTGVSKAFNQGRENELWAIKSIDLSIPERQATLLFGPSGSGKTTLLTLVGCLARPTEGRVRLRDRDVSSYPERFLAGLRRSAFGFIFQQFNLIRGLSALENVMLPAYPLGGDWRALRDRAESLLASLKLGHRTKTQVERLSGGEQQRVAIARALVNNPEVIIADEPTANLDSTLTREFIGILETLLEQGRTLVLTSHDPLLVEAGAIRRVVKLRDGRIAEDS